ncbi:Uncharacterised protein [Vibrio cholerae]|nr:Uncharacterised protein [Vibrio cholerae]CSC53859.1 Uncharacterised protein [Vibrio cholerae]CSI68054.1 Uncharacterised protein [Vibrio cholerae]
MACLPHPNALFPVLVQAGTAHALRLLHGQRIQGQQATPEFPVHLRHASCQTWRSILLLVGFKLNRNGRYCGSLPC